jgi:hypothetical protein
MGWLMKAKLSWSRLFRKVPLFWTLRGTLNTQTVKVETGDFHAYMKILTNLFHHLSVQEVSMLLCLIKYNLPSSPNG